MKKTLALLFVLTMVAVLVLGTVSLVQASPGSQKWYLRNTSYGGTTVNDSAEDVIAPHFTLLVYLNTISRLSHPPNLMICSTSSPALCRLLT